MALASCDRLCDCVGDAPTAASSDSVPSGSYVRKELSENEKQQIRVEFERKLKHKITLRLSDTTLDDAITQLNGIARVGIIVDTRGNVGVAMRKRISMNIEQMEIGQAMDEILKRAEPPLKYEIQPPIVITLREQKRSNSP